MLRDGDLILWVGRASHGGDFLQLMHVPTGLSRYHPGPMKGVNQTELKRRWVTEIEAEIVDRGLTQYIVPEDRQSHQ
ncbi:MAG: hypothetical protein JWP89_2426 [Schlesneria sp.]|nr:hypothetical protein [Schlesneria sp.]